MDYHKNAPWTAVNRERLARMVINEGLTLKAAAFRFSVSAKTATKWVGRYRQFGAAGLADRRYEKAYRSAPIAFKADVDHSWAALASQSWTQCRSAEAAALFEKAFRNIKT
jgi:transposase